MLLLTISFAAGILTILAPCVLPVLPVIIGGSVGSTSKDKVRPYIIATALATSIILFTLLLKVSSWLVNLSPNVLAIFSGGLILLLGVVSIIPELWEKLVVALNWQAMSQRWLGNGERNKDRYIGPILVGIALGPVFASCSPTYAFILASVLPRSFIAGLFYLVAYSLGLVLTLLVLSLAGRRYIRRFGWAIDTRSWFRRGIGILFVLVGLAIITGHQVTAETWIANHLPFDESKIEQTLLTNDSHPLLNAQPVASDILNVPATQAPEFQRLSNWINSKPLTLASLRGKVVLVDFWTYSCINCLRTVPYLEKWYQAYQGDGLVIVGVNTPEFAFEHDPNNVRAAVRDLGITYPVTLDNDYFTWNAYQNNSWPADYLVDRNGYLRYVALGEGDYDKTESAIQALLGLNSQLQTPTYRVPITANQTPETYFGIARQSGLSSTVSSKPNRDGSYLYTATPVDRLEPNTWTLGGNWTVSQQAITAATDGATLSFKFSSKDVYAVATGNGQKMAVGLEDNSTNQFGADAPMGMATIAASRLYHIVSLKQFGVNTVTLHVPVGVSLYTFTFGS